MDSDGRQPMTHITLSGGMMVSVEAFVLLMALEERHFNIFRDGDVLRVQPGHALTPEDRDLIRRHRDELLLLVDHCREVTS